VPGHVNNATTAQSSQLSMVSAECQNRPRHQSAYHSVLKSHQSPLYVTWTFVALLGEKKQWLLSLLINVSCFLVDELVNERHIYKRLIV